jgi:hypothetical protein
MSRATRPRARTDVLVRELDDDVLVFDPVSDRAVSLNRTAAAVWALCDGTRSVEQLAGEATTSLGEPVSPELVDFALDELAASGLLAERDARASRVRGMTRREALRKIALTSAVAVPVVASIAAPAAAQTQSCLPNGTLRTCTNTAPGCVQIVASPQIFRCPDAACCSGFCAIQTPNLSGNCAA